MEVLEKIKVSCSDQGEEEEKKKGSEKMQKWPLQAKLFLRPCHYLECKLAIS
jgi:hypothetical protein